MLPLRPSAPRVTFPGLRPPHPQPSMHQTTASALRGRKHSLLKIAAHGAGLGRTGQGWARLANTSGCPAASSSTRVHPAIRGPPSPTA